MWFSLALSSKLLAFLFNPLQETLFLDHDTTMVTYPDLFVFVPGINGEHDMCLLDFANFAAWRTFRLTPTLLYPCGRRSANKRWETRSIKAIIHGVASTREAPLPT
ncbi:MAG: hypothetical protein P8074_13915 [Anaerolineales bacterium]